MGLAVTPGESKMTVVSSRRGVLLTLAGVAAVGIAVVGQAPAAGVFTAEQAAAGRTSYQQNCAGCHLADLAGRNEAPPLAGGNFMATWRARTTKDLFDYVHTMPPGGPSLTDNEYLNIVAFILQSNGAVAGQQTLAPTTTLAIGSVATGQAAPPALAQAGAGRGQGAGAGRGAAPGAPGRGGPGGRGQ